MTAIAIIGAMDEEVANIATALSNVTVTEEAGVKVTRGTLETNKGTAVNVAATVGGMGTVNIAATTQHLIDADQPDAVIFSGIAGNLNTNLHINDVVLGGTLRYLDTDMRLVGQFKPGTADRPIEEYHSDDRLLELADQALNDLNIHHIVGIIATGNYFVDDPQKVEQVIRETGRGRGGNGRCRRRACRRPQRRSRIGDSRAERQRGHRLRGFQNVRHFRIRGHRRETDGEHRQTHVAFMWRCETPNVAKSRFHIPFPHPVCRMTRHHASSYRQTGRLIFRYAAFRKMNGRKTSGGVRESHTRKPLRNR